MRQYTEEWRQHNASLSTKKSKKKSWQATKDHGEGKGGSEGGVKFGSTDGSPGDVVHTPPPLSLEYKGVVVDEIDIVGAAPSEEERQKADK